MGFGAVSNPMKSDLVEHVASEGVEATIRQLIDAISAAGMVVFARIDHAAGARAAGLTMKAATVLIYGHAKGGTPIMLAAPGAALDLPLRVLVREREDGRTVIAFHPVVPMLRAFGVPDELAARLEPAQQLLVKTVTS
jgi:uncharacterized protein (DUF302 family)